MKNKENRKALVRQYLQSPPDAGIYRIINGLTGSFYLGSDTDIDSMTGKMDFARTTGMYGVLPGNLNQEVTRDGFQHFSLEILERVVVKPEWTREELKEELQLLKEIWQEKLK